MTPPGGKRSRASIAVLGTTAALAAFAAPVAAQPIDSLHTPAAMAATVHELRACLGGLAHSDRRLLTLRFGVGGRPVLTDAQVAARLPPLTPAQVSSRVVIAVRRLTIVRRFGGCKGTPRVATAASSSSLPARPAIAAPIVSHHSGGIAVGELLAIALIVACVLLLGREFRKILFPPLPK